MLRHWKTSAVPTLKLAGPIILGELVQMSLHILDAAMVGAVSYKQLAASSLTFGILTIPFMFGIGITIAIAQMSSMYNGQKNEGKVSHTFFNGMFMSLIVALIIGLGLYFGSDIVFHLGQDNEVAQLAKPFLELMALSLIPMVLFMGGKQFADGLEYTKVAMTISLVAIPINLLINWVLIFGNFGFPRLELAGAGWGTLITRTLMLLALMIYLFRSRLFAVYRQKISKEWYLSWPTIRQLLHIGIPTSMQIVLEAGAFAISGILVGNISATAQAAHQIALSTASTTFMVSMGLSQACSIRISNAFGRKDVKDIQQVGRSTLTMAILYGSFCILILIGFRNYIPYFFNQDPEVVAIASGLLIGAAVFQIPDAIQAIAAGCLRGIRDVKIPTVYIAIGYWALGVPLGYWMAFHLGWDATGIWIGFIVSLSFVAGILSWRFLNIKSIRRLYRKVNQ